MKTLKVNNFACFENLQLSNLKQFNLVSGANSTGKTWLLRAIDILINHENENILSPLSPLLEIMHINDFSYFHNKKKYYIKSNILKITDITIQQYINRLSSLNVNDEYSKNTTDLMLKLLSKNKYMFDSLENYIINNFDADKILPSIASINIFFRNNPQPFSLYELGHGMKRAIMIYFSLLLNKNKIFIIDEAENGLHFDKFDLSIKALIDGAIENNVQLFISTHSNEYAQKFINIIKELKMEDRFNGIYLYKNNDIINVKELNIDDTERRLDVLRIV